MEDNYIYSGFRDGFIRFCSAVLQENRVCADEIVGKSIKKFCRIEPNRQAKLKSAKKQDWRIF